MMMEDTRQRSCKSVHGLVSFFEDLSKGTKDVASVRSISDGHNSISKSSNIYQQSSDLPKSSLNVNSPKLFVENERCKISLEKNANPEKLSYPENRGQTFDLQSDTNHLYNKKVALYEDLSKSTTDILKATSDGPISVPISPYIDQQSAEFSKSTPLMVTSLKCDGENEICKELCKKNEDPDILSPEDHHACLNIHSNANHSDNNSYKDKIKNNDKNTNSVSTTYNRSQSLPTIPETNSAESVSSSDVSERSRRRSDSSKPLNIEHCSNMTVIVNKGPSLGDEFSSVEQQHATNDYNSGILNSSISTIKGIESRTRGMIKSHRISRKFKNTSRRLIEAKTILEKKGLLIIMCNPGDGSTHLGLELLVSYEGYLKGCLKDANELRDFFKHKSIAMLDVPSLFSHSEVGELRQIIKMHSTEDNKLIIIIKNSIKGSCKELLEDHEYKIINFSNQSFQLNADEKKYIISQCIKKSNHDNDKPIRIHCTEPNTNLNEESIPNISKTNTSDDISISDDTLREIAENALSTGFPKQVHNFLSDKHNMLQGVNYFLDPTDTLQDQINTIADTDNYVALIAVLANDSKELDQDTINTLSDSFDDQNQKLKWSCHIIRDVFNKQKRNYSLRECVHNGVQASLGTYLREIQTNTFTFSAKAVETAIMLSLAKEFKPYILKELDDRLFNRFVVTNIAPDGIIKSKSRICINPDEKKIVTIAIERLKKTAMEGNLHSVAAHPLMRDKVFAQMFFDKVKKEPTCTRTLYFMKDSITQKRLISYGLDYTFFNVTSKDNICNISVMILMSEKWSKIRKKHKFPEWIRDKEYPVIDHCFRSGFWGSFIALIDKLNTPNTQNRNYLIESVKNGMQTNLVEILRLDAKKKMFDNRNLHDVAIEALLTYLKDPKENKLLIIETISQNMPSDCKVNCIDAVLFAGKNGNIRLLKSLKRLNADINVFNESQKTCLHLATYNNSEDFVAWALRYCNADQLQYDKSGYMAIHYATENDSENIVQILYNHDNNVLNKPVLNSGLQPLHIAVLNNNTKTAAFLIEHNVDINAKDKNSITPFHYAAKSGKCEVMWLLLKANVDIYVKDQNSMTPLHYAAKFGNLEGLGLLLKADIDINAKDDTSKTPLHYAIIFEKCAIVCMLLNAHVDVDSQDDTLKTPLHYAAISGNCEVMRLLLEADVDIHAKDITSKTPLHYAEISGKYEVICLLRNAHEDIKAKGAT